MAGPHVREGTANAKPLGAAQGKVFDTNGVDAPDPPAKSRERPPRRGVWARAMRVQSAGQTLHELMAVVRKNNRVCPQPNRWIEFYALLEAFADGATLPSPPLTGAAWASTPALSKRMCFREQVEWAVTQDCVTAATTFLKGLPESDWHYGG